jgi:hypothetical protein
VGLFSENSTLEHSEDAIKIELFVDGPQIKPTARLSFGISNQATECMVFPYDFGKKIFIESKGKWIPVKDIMETNSRENVILQPRSGIGIFVAPDLSNIVITSPTNSKVVITGHLCNNKDVVVEKTIPFVVAL